MKVFHYYVVCILFTSGLLRAQEPAWFNQLKPGPVGTYQSSCKLSGILGNALFGLCEDTKGNLVKSKLENVDKCSGENKDIANIDGRLTCIENRPIPTGTYQNSCKDIRVDGGTLFALCKDNQGNFVESTMPTFWLETKKNADIVNFDGKLFCVEKDAVPQIDFSKSPPPGSYLQHNTCRNMYLDKEGNLHAECFYRGRGTGENIVLKNGIQCTGKNIDIDSSLRCMFKDPVTGISKEIDPIEAQTAQQNSLNRNKLQEELIVAIINGNLDFIKSIGSKNPQIFKSKLNPAARGSEIYPYDVAKYFSKENIVTYLEEIKMGDEGYSDKNFNQFNRDNISHPPRSLYSRFAQRPLLERICMLTELFMILQDNEQYDCDAITKTCDELTAHFGKDSAISKPLIDLITLRKEQACWK